MLGSDTCSNRAVGVRRPAWWFYPERCANGHEWGPGLVLVSWERCHCAPARAAHRTRAAWGHLVVACRVPGCGSVWYRPRHEPSAGLAADGGRHLDRRAASRAMSVRE